MKKSTKKIFGFILAGMVVVALVLPKLPLFQTEAENQSPGSQGSSAAVPVEAIVVEADTLRHRVISSGTIRANEQVDLRSETSGKIRKIAFKEGAEVRKDDLLLKINDDELQAQLLKVRQRIKLADSREKRQRQLLEKEAVSRETYDQTLNELENLRAEAKELKARIDKTEIRAPFDGVVGLRYVSEGDFITSSARIATLQDLEQVKIDFSIPEKYVQAVSRGDKIRFTVESLASEFEGVVYAIEPRIDLETRTLQIRARASNTNHAILPGTFAEVELTLEEIPEALMVPTESIVPEFQGKKVFLVKNGKASPVGIETGIRTERDIQVTEGIAVSDTVITKGLLQVRHGADVTIQQFSE